MILKWKKNKKKKHIFYLDCVFDLAKFSWIKVKLQTSLKIVHDLSQQVVNQILH